MLWDHPGRPGPVASVALRARPVPSAPRVQSGSPLWARRDRRLNQGRQAHPVYPDRPANQSKARPANAARKANVAHPGPTGLSCPAGFNPTELTLNARGGQVTIYGCVSG